MSDTNNQKSGNWFSRHKVLTAIGILIIFMIIVSATTNDNNSNTQTSPSSNSDKRTTELDQPQKEKLTIKNSAYSESSGLKQVVGEVTNNDTTVHSATIKATFYDNNGKILGTASGAINEVSPGDTKTFTLLSSDNVTGYKNMKVQVDTLL